MEDLCVWADGTVAIKSEVDSGDYHYMSDDYVVITEDTTIGWILSLDSSIQEALYDYLRG